MTDKEEAVRRLTQQLTDAITLREAAKATPDVAAGRMSLRAWQAARLARTHADLLASERYGRAAAFFLSDLYGPKDFSRRDAEIRRIVPVMAKLLPASGLDTVADALELDAISEALDVAMVAALGPQVTAIDAASYGRAYRHVGQREKRERQIDLIQHLGRALDRLTRQPFVSTALSMMRKPAKLAGLGDLQDVLERGFTALNGMGSVDEFLELIVTRERQILEALFAGDDGVLGGVLGGVAEPNAG